MAEGFTVLLWIFTSTIWVPWHYAWRRLKIALSGSRFAEYGSSVANTVRCRVDYYITKQTIS